MFDSVLIELNIYSIKRKFEFDCDFINKNFIHKKHSIALLLKNAVCYQEPIIDRKNFESAIDYLCSFDLFPISIILTMSAISAHKSLISGDGKGFKIILLRNSEILKEILGYKSEKICIRGIYSRINNAIVLAHNDDYKALALDLLHEMSHKCFKSCVSDNFVFNVSKNYWKLYNAYGKTLNNIKRSDFFSEQFKKDFMQMINSYGSTFEKMRELLSDLGCLTIYIYENFDNKKEFLKEIEPLYKYFEEIIKPHLITKIKAFKGYDYIEMPPFGELEKYKQIKLLPQVFNSFLLLYSFLLHPFHITKKQNGKLPYDKMLCNQSKHKISGSIGLLSLFLIEDLDTDQDVVKKAFEALTSSKEPAIVNLLLQIEKISKEKVLKIFVGSSKMGMDVTRMYKYEKLINWQKPATYGSYDEVNGFIFIGIQLKENGCPKKNAFQRTLLHELSHVVFQNKFENVEEELLNICKHELFSKSIRKSKYPNQRFSDIERIYLKPMSLDESKGYKFITKNVIFPLSSKYSKYSKSQKPEEFFCEALRVIQYTDVHQDRKKTIEPYMGNIIKYVKKSLEI